MPTKGAAVGSRPKRAPNIANVARVLTRERNATSKVSDEFCQLKLAPPGERKPPANRSYPRIPKGSENHRPGRTRRATSDENLLKWLCNRTGFNRFSLDVAEDFNPRQSRQEKRGKSWPANGISASSPIFNIPLHLQIPSSSSNEADSKNRTLPVPAARPLGPPNVAN